MNVVTTLRGLGFQPDSVVSACDGVTVSNPTYLGPTAFRVTLPVEPTAATGPRDVSVANLGPAWNAAMITFDRCACLTVL